MPTGYTATLMEKGQTFQEFILGCARAFGACIEMRDSPNDTPIPDKFEPSGYHVKWLIESREKLAKLKAMTDAEKESFGQAEKTAEIQRIEQWLEKDRAQNKRLKDMAAQVQAWDPPTDDHRGLKDFMLQQISISRNSLNYIQDLLGKAIERPAMAYYVAEVSGTVSGIGYHTKENVKEIERAYGRTEWIQKLRESI